MAFCHIIVYNCPMDVAIKLLVVDDEQEMCNILQEYFTDSGFDVVTVNNAEQAIKQLDASEFDCLLTDMRMPGIGGMGLLKQLRDRKMNVPVVMMTAFGTVDSAVEAMKSGAFHFVKKPFKLNELKTIVEQASEVSRVRRENRLLRRQLQERHSFANIIGKSKAMQDVFARIAMVADSPSSVLITGASGTGKELVARAIHFSGRFKDGPFVPVNCSAIPDTLLESELFGHVKGAFTGAHATRRGLFKEAEGGTLFLDEIGDLTMSVQAKLLRVLQEKVVRPVGSDKSFPVKARIIAATNQDLEEAVRQGQFRQDLYYRLAVIPIRLPTLGERQEDIPLLIAYFTEKFSREQGKALKKFTVGAVEVMMQYEWQGNVRELENMVERLVVLSPKEVLDVDDLPERVRNHAKARREHFVSLVQMEADYIRRVLKYTNGNKLRASRILGINRRTLYRKMERLGLADNNGEINSETRG